MKITWCYPFNMYSFKIHGISGEREITSDYSKYITSEKQMRLCGRLILFLLFLLLLCFISFTVFILNIWIALLFCYKTNILKSWYSEKHSNMLFKSKFLYSLYFMSDSENWHSFARRPFANVCSQRGQKLSTSGIFFCSETVQHLRNTYQNLHALTQSCFL